MKKIVMNDFLSLYFDVISLFLQITRAQKRKNEDLLAVNRPKSYDDNTLVSTCNGVDESTPLHYDSLHQNSISNPEIN